MEIRVLIAFCAGRRLSKVALDIPEYWMNSLRFWFDSPLSADKHHSTRGCPEIGGVDAVTLLFFVHDGANIDDQILVGSAFPQHRAQIVIVLAEQAGAQLAVGGEADARAVTTEGLRDRGDQTDLTGGIIGEAVLARGFAALVRDLLQRPAGMNALVDLGSGNHRTARPQVVGIQRHEFDEAHDYAALPGKSSEVFDLVVIGAAYEDGVNLCRCQWRILRSVDATHDRAERLRTGDFLEFSGVE